MPAISPALRQPMFNSELPYFLYIIEQELTGDTVKTKGSKQEFFTNEREAAARAREEVAKGNIAMLYVLQRIYQ